MYTRNENSIAQRVPNKDLCEFERGNGGGGWKGGTWGSVHGKRDKRLTFQ